MEIRNILVLGMYPYAWDHQEISDTMRMMTRAFRGVNRMFINPSVGFRRARADGLPLRFSWSQKEREGVRILTPPLELLPSSLGLGRLKNAWALGSLEKRIASLLGANWRDNTVLYLSSGGIAPSFQVMEALRPRWTVFDVLDDNLNFPGITEDQKAALERQFRHILSRATLVTAVSRFLTDRLKEQFGADARLLPNGLDVQRFADHPAYRQPLPDLANLERPLYGFVGGLTSWIDFELLWNIAEELGKGNLQGTLVLVGPVIESAVPGDLMDRLRNHGRVVFPGAKPYGEVPHYLHQFDVLLLPRNYEPHSLASDPLKLYEYMATGKPIVSTALPSVQRFEDVVFIGRTHGEFLACLAKALKEWSPEKAEKMKTMVREFSWDKRAETMLELLLEKARS